MRSTLYNHVLTPNAKLNDCMGPQNPLRPAWKAARSHHPGGVNVLFCDGHVTVRQGHGEPGKLDGPGDPKQWRSSQCRQLLILHKHAKLHFDLESLVMTRRVFTCLSLSAGLCFLSEARAQDAPSAQEVETCLSRVLDYHGHLGPWAVIGYRVGERVLKETGLHRSSKDLVIVHYCPEAVQYTCMLDGLHAATGASIGKLTLKHEVVPAQELRTVVVDRQHGRRYEFTVNPELVSSILNLDHEHQISEARRVAGLVHERLFRVVARSAK